MYLSYKIHQILETQCYGYHALIFDTSVISASYLLFKGLLNMFAYHKDAYENIHGHRSKRSYSLAKFEIFFIVLT